MKPKRMLYTPAEIHRNLAPVFKYKISLLKKKPVINTRNFFDHVAALRFQIKQGIDLIINLLLLYTDQDKNSLSSLSCRSGNQYDSQDYARVHVWCL